MPNRTRREWLGVIGTVGAVGIAGCGLFEETAPPVSDLTQQAKLAASDGDRYDSFGRSVALSSDGSTALIGAAEDEDPNGTQAGSAYVFE